MKTAIIAASLTRKGGGLLDSLLGIARTLRILQKIEVSALGLHDENALEDYERWSPVPVTTFPIRGPKAFGYAPGMKTSLVQGGFDLVHAHGIWMYPSAATVGWSQRTKKPYLVAPHGMLDPWTLTNSRWKKRIVALWFENRNLHGAACLHALCEAEAKAIRAYGLKNPICVIPNGIDLPQLVDGSKLMVDSPLQSLKSEGRKLLLYLGRIHPKKGLVNLLKAWAAVRKTEDGRRTSENWVLAIAGWDQGGHQAELKALCSELRVESSVQFLGSKFGEEKAACYRNCDAFILPSFSEGLPMVVLEAWSYAKLVLMTPECNLPEGFVTNAAIRIEPNVESIEIGLRELFATNDASRAAFGVRGCALVADKFTWPTITAEIKSVYEWILGGGAKPPCVIN